MNNFERIKEKINKMSIDEMTENLYDLNFYIQDWCKFCDYNTDGEDCTRPNCLEAVKNLLLSEKEVKFTTDKDALIYEDEDEEEE